MKRFISALVALAMILSMVPAVFATESGSSLALGENVLVLNGSEFDGKSWTYTATEAGTLTISLEGIVMPSLETGEGMEPLDSGMWATALSWFFQISVTKNGSDVYGDSVTSYAVEVAEDDTVTVTLVAAGYPGEFTWDLAFEAASTPDPEPTPSGLVLGDNNVSLEAGDQDGDSWTYTATEAGNLTVSVTGLSMMNVDYETGEEYMEAVPEMYIEMVIGMQCMFTVSKNGEALPIVDSYINFSVDVEEGDVITVSLVSGMGNAMEATLTLTLGESSGDSGATEPAQPGTMNNPIVIETLPYEIVAEGTHDVYYTYTADKACTLLITKPEGNYVSIDGNWEPGDEANTYFVSVAAGETIGINPWGNNSGTYTIAVMPESEPTEPTGPITGTGAYNDPYVIYEMGTYTWGTGGLYFKHTATVSGKLTFTVNGDNWSNFYLRNTNSGITTYVYKSNGVYTCTVELYKGDVVEGYIYATKDNGAVDTSVTFAFEECDVDKTVAVNANRYYVGTGIAIAPDSRVNCQVTFNNPSATLYVMGENFYAVVDGERMDPDADGKLVLPFANNTTHTVYLYNTGDEVTTCVFGFDYLLGSSENPEVLEDADLGDITVSVTENGYYYTWIATESGNLTFTMLEESNWEYEIANTTTYESYWSSDYFEDYEKTATVVVREGDVISVYVVHDDRSEGALSFNLSFEAGAVENSEEIYPDEYTFYYGPMESAVVPAGGSFRYDVVNYLGDGKLTIAGENFYVVVGGTGVYNEETGLFLPEGGTRYDPVDGVVILNLPTYMKSTVHIVNTGSEDATYLLDAAYPIGTQSNPDMITGSGSVSLDEEAGDYYFGYVAPGEGYVVVTITSDGGVSYVVMNYSNYVGSDYMNSDDASNGISYSVPVFYGDLVYIAVNTWDVDYSIPGGDIEVSVEFVEAPFVDYIYPDAEIKMDGSGNGVYMLEGFYECDIALVGSNFYAVVNGERMDPVDGMLIIPRGPIMIELVNTSEETNVIVAGASYPVGSMDNPEELTFGSHTFTTPVDYGYANRYWYTFTAQESGTVVFSFKNNNWDAYVMPDYDMYSGEDLGYSFAMEVEAGATYNIGIVTGDWTIGTVTFEFAVGEGTGEGGNDGEHDYLGDGYELIDGDNYVEVEADSEYGSEWYYIPTMTGNLTLTITDLLCYVDGEWGDLDLITLGNGLRLGSVSLWIGDTQVFYDMDNDIATATISVVAGTPVFITMGSANGTALRATFTLACESNLHEVTDGNLVDGNNQFTTVKGETSDFTYTATADGKLVIELMSAGYWNLDELDELYIQNFYVSELFDLLSGIVMLTVNGEEFVVDRDTYPNLYLVDMDVKKGDVITLSFTNNFYVDLIMNVAVSIEAGEAGPNIIDELPAELVADFATIEDAYDVGMTWLYTATQDGVLEFLGVSEGLQIMVFVNGDWVYGYGDGEAFGEAIVKEGDEVEIMLFAYDAGTYSCIVAYAEEADVVMGDVNGDGEIDTKDANLICSYYNELLELSDAALAAADVNGDGEVDTKDANLICSFYNELIDKFPVEE